ncbi:Inner membrane protein YgaP [Polystyrenella longa]|uniref:Inner membrane protein YgaP n=1 Tax=Polystyrenella longa TaxID=2528007 RepID=A0A518CKD0_9PLAN|nr:rhodanese-like domain-containing protein [Polystyrenella longa]QDU79680.1 Inner membrane protein YgaP [Polystyrenella longa]
MSLTTIRPEEVHRKLKSGEQIKLIDVRTPAEFQEVHATPAENHPLDQLDFETLKQLASQSDQPLYVLCKSGTRGKMACEKMMAAGIDNVVNMEGGTNAWMEQGYEVVRGESKVISLERQVRIAAGSLVLIGVAAGWFLHPAFYGLSAFVGAGLVFAGVTDTCGMAMMLGRMPWNQVCRPAAQPADKPLA